MQHQRSTALHGATPTTLPACFEVCVGEVPRPNSCRLLRLVCCLFMLPLSSSSLLLRPCALRAECAGCLRSVPLLLLSSAMSSCVHGRGLDLDGARAARLLWLGVNGC